MDIFRDVKGYEGIYMVSLLGVVYRIYKTKPPKELKPMNHSGGYKRVKLRNKGNDTDAYIHRLVAEAWIDKPEGKNIVNHINGDKTNNQITNLEWVNQRENVTHGKKSNDYVGVHYKKKDKTWSARIMINGIRHTLGSFSCKTAAHFAYLKALKEYNLTNKYA